MPDPTPAINIGELGLRATQPTVPTLGMRGTHTWTDSELPRGYREGMLFLQPNSSAPLAAMLSKLAKKRESQSHYHWFSRNLQYKGADVDSDITINGSAGDNNISSGDVVLIPVDGAFGYQVRQGHLVLLRQTNEQSQDVVLKVTGVVRGGTTSVVQARAISDSPGTATPAFDRMIIVGNYNAEASARPAAISYNAREYGNMQQIWRNPLAMSRTDMQNRSRLGDRYQIMKRDAGNDHLMEQEFSLLFGEMSWELGTNGMPERTTQGIIPFVRENAPQNVVDCARAAVSEGLADAGDAFTDFGLELLEDYLIRPSFQWGDATEKMVFCGSGVMSAIQKVVRASTDYQIQHNVAAYGIKVSTLTTIHGDWHFYKHPMFTHEASLTNALLAFEPSKLEWRYSLDMKYEKDVFMGKGGGDGIDGIREGFITEGGLAIYHPELIMYATNFGLAALAPVGT